MPNQIKPIFITMLFICLSLSVINVSACTCFNSASENATEELVNAINASTSVFSGKVIGFEYREGIHNEYMDSRAEQTGERVDYETKVVKFQVAQWWKGEATRETFLVTNNTRNADGTSSFSSCDFHFKEGESYLIYARGNLNELRTGACTGTRTLAEAEEDLKILGEGKAPLEKKEEPNKSLERRRVDVLSSRGSCG